MDHAVLWQQTAVNWILNNKHHPVLVVTYEQLKNHTSREFLRILNFLDVPYSSEKLAEVGWSEVGKKAVRGTYDMSQVDYVNSMISKMAELLSSSSQTRGIDVSPYFYRYS